MKIPIDIDTYKARFLGGNARQYLFYVSFNFPDFGNALKDGLQEGVAGGIPTGINSLSGLDALFNAGKSAAFAGAGGLMDTIGLNNGTKDFSYYVKSTNLPTSDIDPISSFWCGQEYKMASLQKFEDWTVTLNVDHTAEVLKKFWAWQKIIHDPESNIYGRPTIYMADQEIHLLGMDSGETICVYKLFGAWPKSIGQVSLDYGSNEFANVDITFTFQYFSIREKEEGALANYGKRAARGFISNIV
jgi:hypothetical protein